MTLLIGCGPTDLNIQQSEEVARGGDSRVALELRVDRKLLKPGDTAHIRLTVTNTVTEVAIYESQDTPVLDIKVARSGDPASLASWSSQHADQVIHHLELKPGEKIVMEMQWLVPLDQSSGELSVAGLLYKDSKVIAGAPGGVCVNLCR